MQFFVEKHSVVRKIWGKSDTILFIFAGSAAEFALNKAVNWLYFTGKLPADPLGRLFSTVNYARLIVFSPEDEANKAIDKISAIHSAIENARGADIPDWAYRDVLFMLIDYSVRAYELLERKLTFREKEEVFDVFYRVGKRMQVKDLPENYNDWLIAREVHLQNDLIQSKYTFDLYKQYKKHLGFARYAILIEGQKLVVPEHVMQLLHLKKILLLKPVVVIYKFSRLFKLDRLIKAIILPPTYKSQIKELDIATY